MRVSGSQAPFPQEGTIVPETGLTLVRPVCGDTVLEKQSRFLACGAPVPQVSDPSAAVQLLVPMFRMAKASHLSWACRLSSGLEFKNDGGESGAGSCVLEVMRNMHAVNCVVLVARWYGGKHLGGARFRIYRDSARALLTSHGVPAAEKGDNGSVQ